MDKKTALHRHRLNRLHQLSARVRKTRPEGGEKQDNVIEFAGYRDEYGRYQEDDRAQKAGIGGAATAGAIGAGLYARGRMSGAIGPSGLERKFEDFRNRRAGLIGRQTGTVNGGMATGPSVGDRVGTFRKKAGVVGKNARTAFRGARTEVGNRGAGAIPKVSRKYLRSFLTKAGKGLRALR